jgi:hypothetical protein
VVLTSLTGVGPWTRGLVFRCVLGSEGCVLVPRSSGTPVAMWAWPIWVGVGDVCWKPCSSCWSFHLLREEFLSAPIHSPLSDSPYRSFTHPAFEYWGQSDPTQVAQLKVSKVEMIACAKNIFGGRIRNKECPKVLGIYNPADPVSLRP